MLESLGFSSVTFVITLINIAILTVIFRAVLFRPVTKFIEERARKIQNDKDEAEKSRADAAQLSKRLEERLKNAEAEADEIIRAARSEAADEAQAIVDRGKAEAEQFLVQARAQARAEYQAALRAFQAAAAALVVQAASKLVRRNLAGQETDAAEMLRDLDGFPGGPEA